MGRYFGREPRYSREELERQAQEAIDARVSLGRPPDEDFRPLEARLEALDEAILSRPPVEPQRQPVTSVVREEPALSPTAAPPARLRVARRLVGARREAN